MTATPASGRVPDVWANDRGDLRLFRCDPRDGVWHQVYRGYAHDPVCLPAGGFVVHRGAGLTYLDAEGAVVREVKVGKFGWGPPSLSVSPAGDTVAWVKWEGDHRKLRVEGVGPGVSTRFRTSVYRYAWLDSLNLIYLFGSGPRLLDIASGRARRFGPGLRRWVDRGVTGSTAQLRELAELSADQLWEDYRDLQVVGDDVWFSATLVERSAPRRVDGLFRTDPAGSHLHLVATLQANDRVEWFFALPDRSVLIGVATYQGTTIVGRHRSAVGLATDFMTDGWSPIPTSHTAEFGFHRLP